jgi:hypothetical protein
MSANLPGSADGSLRGYEALCDHAELELELAGRGEVEGLAQMSARWEQLTAALPAEPPAAAAPLLERARMLHERTRIDLLRLRESLLAELAEARRASRAASGYAGVQPAGGPQLDRHA